MSAKKTVSPKKQFDFDAIVIGTGPGGEGAAMYLAKSGLKVAAIERYQSVGGGCTHWGTIPSKALRHSVSRLIEFNENPLFQLDEQHTKLTFSQILKHAAGVIRKQVRLRTGFYDRNQVRIYQGEATFLDNHHLSITGDDGSCFELSAKTIVIATGSRPYRPADVDFNHDRIYDSDTILSLQHDPKHIIVYGAGVIGCEYASIFRGLGVRVDLVNTRDRLLSFMDTEISDSLSYHFWNSGMTIRHGEEFDKIEGTADGVVLHLKS
ncbi:MAG TPA: FAD-dependent oxidoreductase, partial [Rheinheimera sp.]|nr:FAD-dependent oxidoreductase [Rheinheimera sp.]